MPPAHDVPGQQSSVLSHGWPAAWQGMGPHVPLRHAFEQQAPADGQGCPSGVQVGPAHMPWLQTFEQHVAASVQVAPAGAHDGTHCPWLHTFEQQSAARTQAAPCWPQLPHWPLLQTLEQQSLDSTQVAPVAPHGGAHVPFWQVSPVQHPFVHASPVAPQSVQTEFAQVPLQHSENAAHARPPTLHCVPVVVVVVEPPGPNRCEPPLPHPLGSTAASATAAAIQAKALIATSLSCRSA
jgi:hypothetical protein